MSSGKRPMDATKGKQHNTEALCQPQPHKAGGAAIAAPPFCHACVRALATAKADVQLDQNRP